MYKKIRLWIIWQRVRLEEWIYNLLHPRRYDAEMEAINRARIILDGMDVPLDGRMTPGGLRSDIASHVPDPDDVLTPEALRRAIDDI